MTTPGTDRAAPPDERDSVLRTSVGDFPLHEYNLRLAGRAWSVLHTGAVLGFWEEQRYLSEQRNRSAYGVALWSSAIALAHELAARGDALRGR
ncbi:MAG TPA: hypothetical protein VFJ74_12390, partial [Gemmatimonadaceae bacterium]|nr:hypothetical protein [Gemmatimonadaceae bacterium]